MELTEKRRLLATLGGGRPDRIPVFDLEPAESTLDLWREQGLPAHASFAEHFGIETHEQVGVEIRSSPFYRGAPDLLDSPEAFDRHYDLDDPERYPAGWERRCRSLNQQGRVVCLNASGGGLLQMLGVRDWESLVDACDALVNRARFVEELLERTVDFHCRILELVLSRVRVDYASLYEPIASNAGPLVSPEMFERYSMPGYRRVLDLLQRHGVELRVFCTTGGDLGPLLPMLVDAGINCLWISNIMTESMSYRALRREYGPEMAFIGGIDSRTLNGTENDIRHVVHETVPLLLEGGRYLPCLDDRPRDTTPFTAYCQYRRELESCCDAILKA